MKVRAFFCKIAVFLAALLLLPGGGGLLFAGAPGSSGPPGLRDESGLASAAAEAAPVPEKETRTEARKGAQAAESFNAGQLILDHVLDQHSWHICDWKGKKVEIHLPVILLWEGKLHVFSSRNFDNPRHEYGPFQLRQENPYKGKIVVWETAPDGSRAMAASRPLDFSITKTVFGLMVSTLFLLIVFAFVVRSYKRDQENPPKGIAALFEPVYLFIRDDIVYPNMGKEQGDRYLPYLAALFFFILFGNILGLVPFFPFGANTTGNISVTLVLALLTFLITMASSTRTYWKHVFDTPGVPVWMKIPVPLMPVIELIEVLVKPFVLMVRLFANITAGHIVLLGFVALVLIFGSRSVALGYVVSPLTLLLGLFSDCLELLVSFIQAYVFTLLSANYFGGAMGWEASGKKA